MSAQMCGGLREIEANDLPDIELKVVQSLAALGNQEDAPTFAFGKIVSAHKQVVAGIVYHVVAQITHGSEQKECKLRIWERPWTGECTVDIDCDDKSFKVVRNAAEKEKWIIALQTNMQAEMSVVMRHRWSESLLTGRLSIFYQYRNVQVRTKGIMVFTV